MVTQKLFFNSFFQRACLLAKEPMQKRSHLNILIQAQFRRSLPTGSRHQRLPVYSKSFQIKFLAPAIPFKRLADRVTSSHHFTYALIGTASVHGHWLLVQLLRVGQKDAAWRYQTIRKLNQSFTKEKLQGEVANFARWHQLLGSDHMGLRGTCR